jgi:hypothetical protein
MRAAPDAGLVEVRVMNVRIVRVPVRHRFVSMRMGVRLLPVPRERVRVPVMRVVHVRMRVLDGLVNMLMVVALGQM